MRTTLTCIEEPRSIIHQQLALGPVEKKSSLRTPESEFGILNLTEFGSEVFGITSALKSKLD
jgi:hypothetical protein